jgi:AraC-like DNA-binding protein
VEQNNYMMILQGRYELPLHVQQKGKIDKVTIVFKPLGLNHFIKSSYNEIACEPTQIFSEWNKDKSSSIFLNLFYGEPDNNKRIQILEEYLLLHYTFLNETAILKVTLNMLNDFNTELSVERISKSLLLNTRTFNRLFHKHLGISPVAFRKIARFRHSLKNRLFENRFATLTKIGYESNFYDQSYFNKVYKNLTGQNPKTFFSSISKLADDRLIFRFMKT